MQFQVNARINRYCPECTPPRKLIVKVNHHTDHQFLGCPNWPACEHTEEIPESIRLMAAGAQMLPGLEV